MTPQERNVIRAALHWLTSWNLGVTGRNINEADDRLIAALDALVASRKRNPKGK